MIAQAVCTTWDLGAWVYVPSSQDWVSGSTYLVALAPAAVRLLLADEECACAAHWLAVFARHARVAQALESKHGRVGKANRPRAVPRPVVALGVQDVLDGGLDRCAALAAKRTQCPRCGTSRTSERGAGPSRPTSCTPDTRTRP